MRRARHRREETTTSHQLGCHCVFGTLTDPKCSQQFLFSGRFSSGSRRCSSHRSSGPIGVVGIVGCCSCFQSRFRRAKPGATRPSRRSQRRCFRTRTPRATNRCSCCCCVGSRGCCCRSCRSRARGEARRRRSTSINKKNRSCFSDRCFLMRNLGNERWMRKLHARQKNSRYSGVKR